MFVKQNNYEELIFRKEPRYFFVWMVFMIVGMAILIFISFFYKFNKFYEINGLVINKGSDNYVQILVENDKLDIVKNDNLIFDKKEIKFKYEINSYFYSDSGKIYREIKLFFENDLYDGQLVNFVFKSAETTLMNELKIGIQKGLM
ncbi:MAG: hypothetical protein E7165_00325 [Firmicutes bacterium]|nr:hypothetical protein [Bacillota bacterium]